MYDPLHTTHDLLPSDHFLSVSLLPTHYILLPTHYILLSTVLTTYHSPLTTYYSLLLIFAVQICSGLRDFYGTKLRAGAEPLRMGRGQARKVLIGAVGRTGARAGTGA